MARWFFWSVYSPSSQAFSPLFSSQGCYLFNNPITMERLIENDILFAAQRLSNKFTASLGLIPSFLVKDCAMVFGKSLFVIFNLILKTSTFPESWKTSSVTPVFESDDRIDISNYCPISVLTFTNYRILILPNFWCHEVLVFW